MQVLLTGATGFVGHHLLAHMPPHWKCFALARHSQRLPATVQPIEGDLADSDWLKRLPGRMDAVIHVSQSREYRAFPDQALDVFGVNTASTARLLDYASRSGVTRFCLLSTGSVYEPFDKPPLAESVALEPSSINATTKLAAEILCGSYSSVFAISILRVFFPYGPGQTDRLIPTLIDRIGSKTPVDLAGEEGMIFSPLFVLDLVNIITASVESEWRGIFNVAGSQSLSVMAASEIIASRLGCKAQYRRSDQPGLCMSPSLEKLGKIFDVESMTGFKAGLEQTLGWQK